MPGKSNTTRSTTSRSSLQATATARKQLPKHALADPSTCEIEPDANNHGALRSTTEHHEGQYLDSGEVSRLQDLVQGFTAQHIQVHVAEGGCAVKSAVVWVEQHVLPKVVLGADDASQVANDAVFDDVPDSPNESINQKSREGKGVTTGMVTRTVQNK